MIKCPVCDSQIAANNNYCSNCGTRLNKKVPEKTEVISLQEEIKEIKKNDITFNVCVCVGALMAVEIPFLMRFVLLYTMDTFSWLLTSAGILLFISGCIGLFYDDRKVKSLVQRFAVKESSDDPNSGRS